MNSNSNVIAYSDPFGAGSEERPNGLPPIDYTSQDYLSLKRQFYRIARSMFGERYNNFTESDLGQLLAEYIAAHGDFVSFKGDFIMNEAIFVTALLAKNVRRHARGLGYRARPRLAAQYDMTISVAEPFDVDITIQAGLPLQASGPDGEILYLQIFSADEAGKAIESEDMVIPAGVRSINNVIGIEGERRTIEARGTGQPGQAIRLPDQNVLSTTIKVYVDGELWEEVETIYSRGPENVYRIDENARDSRYFVNAGDGSRGNVFPESSVIEITYRIGGGPRGNVPSGVIALTENVAVPGAGLTAPVTITNRTRGKGGSDRESIEEIKANLPNWMRRQFRLIHLDDYSGAANEFWSEGIGRIARGRAYLRHAGCSANIIDIFVAEYVNDTMVARPSDALIEAFSERVEDERDAVHTVCVKPGRVVEVGVRVFVDFPRSYASRKSEAESLVEASLSDFFNIRNWTFGRPLKPGEIEKQIVSKTPAVSASVSFDMDLGFDLEADGSYDTHHHEIVRPRPFVVTVSFNGDRY